MIYEGDVKVLKSEVLLDTPDGGGGMTALEVVDGVSNNLFPDISELDRTYGRIALRKFFPAIVTTSVDSYYGAHAIISRKPKDPLVHASLFSTGDSFDRRVDAKDRVEQYLARGPKWAGHILEAQVIGQRAIQQVTRVSEPEPKVGQGLVLTYHEGIGGEYEQYVRVTRVTSEIRLFTVSGKDIERKVLTIEISDPLRYNFLGPTVAEFENNIDMTNRASLRDTRVANAATYYGISALALDAALSDATVKVEDIFTQLVPASQAETAMVDLLGSGLSSLLVPAASGTLTRTFAGYPLDVGSKLYIGSPVYPGTLTITAGANTFTEAGGVVRQGATSVGIIDYSTGLVTFSGSATPVYTGSISVAFKPAATPSSSVYSTSIFIDQGTRGYNYARTLNPHPSPTSLIVSYIAQGKVYYLYEQGDGTLKGSDSSYGAGSVNFTTGTVLVTLGVLPDADTDILIHWGSTVSTFDRSGLTVETPAIYMKLAAVELGKVFSIASILISWAVAGVTKTAAVSKLGVISGDATGRMIISTGEIRMRTAVLVQQGQVFSVSYDQGDTNHQEFTGLTPDGGGYVSMTLPDLGSAVVPGSVSLSWATDSKVATVNRAALVTGLPGGLVGRPVYDETVVVRANDLEATPGDLTGSWQQDDPYANPGNSDPLGEITYASRVVRIKPDTTVTVQIPDYYMLTWGPPQAGGYVANQTYIVTGYTPTTLSTKLPAAGGVIAVTWRTAVTVTTEVESFSATDVRFNLTPGFSEYIIPGSVVFTLGSFTYVDRNGSLYHSVSPTTGAGTYAGTINYATGNVAISDWDVGAAPGLTIKALGTQMSFASASEVVFRVPIVPVRPSSVQFRAVAVGGDGAEFTATLDGTGKVSTSNVTGTINYQTGIVRLSFGVELLITGLNRAAVEAQPWYTLAAEYTRSGSQYIFQPKPIFLDTLRYNAVGYTYLPLSADILGLDPVRLPADGRVPIFSLGSVVVVHNTQKLVFPSPAIGATLDLGRLRVSYARLYDSLGARLPDNMYSVNLLTGIVTLTGSYALGSYTAPLYVENRIEDMSLVTDVQINGQLALSKPLSHAYEDGVSFVSSALVIGDVQARAHTVFSQGAWTGAWQDSRIGSEIIAQYNATLNPIAVTNRGSINEQWAIIFESNSTYRVVGRSVGVLATAVPLLTDVAPGNPNFPGSPYFALNGSGGQWGGGWVAGNVLRFNTTGANYPLWGVRTVLQGEATEVSDSFQLAIRGDIDRP